MFDSEISAAELIADLQEEADIAIAIPNKLYVQWLNSLEQLLYADIIREQRVLVLESSLSVLDSAKYIEKTWDLSEFKVEPGEDAIRYEDIYTVYNGGIQLIRTTVKGGNGDLFPNSYYKMGNALAVYGPETGFYKAIYFARPALKSVNASDEVQVGNVMIPIEYIDLVKSRLRGEAYKLANEDALAAKWLNDYNSLLEYFKAWVQSREAVFGV